MLKIPRTFALIAVLAAGTARAQATARLSVPTTKLWFEGTSNVHEWKCDAPTVDAAVEVDAAAAATSIPKALRKVSVVIPVRTMKCGHDKMDDNMYKALNADDKSTISYQMTSVELLPAEGKDAFSLRMTGTLTISGTTNTMSMDIAGSRLADGTIKATGTVPVKMTAYGVKPPKAMLGAIRAGDEVKVMFEMIVGPKIVAALEK